ncbi:hypothetical protein ACE2AJ_14010 [Aquihabitans daechungensis]|uniref:hypothetical protein n=1 Tax=Aquihabitans daechungensis TaxID=1052257 RepID=UPI003BA0D2CE
MPSYSFQRVAVTYTYRGLRVPRAPAMAPALPTRMTSAHAATSVGSSRMIVSCIRAAWSCWPAARMWSRTGPVSMSSSAQAGISEAMQTIDMAASSPVARRTAMA